jgi:hypothetical protein
MVSSLSFRSPVKDFPATVLFERALLSRRAPIRRRKAAFNNRAKINEEKVESSVDGANWQSCQSMLSGACWELLFVVHTAETDSYGNGLPVISIGARSTSSG